MDKEKLLVDILKIKLLFFSALVGGSFGYLLKSSNFYIGVNFNVINWSSRGCQCFI